MASPLTFRSLVLPLSYREKGGKRPLRKKQCSLPSLTARSPPRTPHLSRSSSVTKLRPVLEHRMPTLVSKAAFLKPVDEASAIPRHPGLQELESSPPRTLKEARHVIRVEIGRVGKRLARLERAYYGDSGNLSGEVERYAFPLKNIMKCLLKFDMNSARAVDELIKLCADPKRYKGDAKYVAMLKEMYQKVMSFMPDKVMDVLKACEKLYEYMDMFCVSFYNRERDCYLETADHYQEQINNWKQKIETSLHHAKSLSYKFKSKDKSLHVGQLSGPVATFCARHDMVGMIFVLLFADSISNMRNALSMMTSWLAADENYATYVRNDVLELESLKEEKRKSLREIRTKYHSQTYKLNQLEQESHKMTTELINLRDKEQILRIEEVHFVNVLGDIELEIEFKERRRNKLQRKAEEPEEEKEDQEDAPSVSMETIESLTMELKTAKEKVPGLQKQVAGVRFKLHIIDEKSGALERVAKEIDAVKHELKETDKERKRQEKEYLEVEQAVEVARRIQLCKTANDAVEKLYYAIPVGLRMSKARRETRLMDPLDQVCRMVSAEIDRDWVKLYRNLPFFPPRGEETIEQDISDLSATGARGPIAALAANALARWRRHHTRAKVEDLRQTLTKIKRTDITQTLDSELAPRPVKWEVQDEVEERPPPVGPELLPFFRQVERYDQLKAAGKL